jgi:hypothetical protein
MNLSEQTAFGSLDVEEIRLLDTQKRIQYVKEEHWLPYRRANALLKKLEELLEHPKRYRMPCLAVVGISNCGKTMLLREFETRHKRTERPLRESALVPVLYVQCPPQADRGELYDAILEALNAPYKLVQKPGAKLKIVLHIMRQCGVRMLLLDELNQAISVQKKQALIFLSSLKHLSNELLIPVVVGGTQAVGTTINNDTQFASRFTVKTLKVWKLDNEFLKLLKTLSESAVLRGFVDLATPEIAPVIFGLSEGYMGDVVELVRKATIRALEKGEETITAKTFEEIDWIPPALRKKDSE